MMNDIMSEADQYSNFGGRRKMCRQQGLKGKELNACAKQLKSSGWKKGMPIPADMGGVSASDVDAVEKEEAAAKAAPPKSNAMMYVIVGVVLLVIVIGVVVMIRMRKKAE
jgi:cobalamin biosynthesis Mg chelatase CobN